MPGLIGKGNPGYYHNDDSSRKGTPVPDLLSREEAGYCNYSSDSDDDDSLPGILSPLKYYAGLKHDEEYDDEEVMMKLGVTMTVTLMMMWTMIVGRNVDTAKEFKESDEWLVVSGASGHVAEPEEHMYDTTGPTKIKKVTVANGDVEQVRKQGKVDLKDSKTGKAIHINKIHHVLGLKKSLLSGE